jgi:hypothetical protein
MTSTSSAASLLAALLALAAAPAGASPGNGIRLGGSEGRLHPYLDLEGRWDSNVFYTPDDRSVGDFILHVRPGFQLDVPAEPVAVKLGGNLDWAQYLGQNDSNTSDLSKLYAQAALGVSVNRRGMVGLELDDEFRRSPSTSAFVLDGAVIANYNALRLKVPFRPGGGALVVSLTGGWKLETFEPFGDCPATGAPATCDAGLLDDLGYNELRGGAEARWRFLPRTSAVFDAGWFSRQPNDAAARDVSGLELRAGVAGLVTPHVGATVKLGYADTFASAGSDFRTWLAILEAEWLLSELASVKVGYTHALGVDPGSALSVYTSSRLTAGARYGIGGRYNLRADVSWERRSYGLAAGDPTADLLHLEPSLEAAISPWLSASLGYGYTNRDSSFAAAPGFSYSKNEAWLRVALTY